MSRQKCKTTKNRQKCKTTKIATKKQLTWDSIEKVEKIASPLLVIHGIDDTVTPLNQAREIYECASNPVKPLFIEEMGHWGIELDPKLLNRIKEFVLKEL